MNEENIPDLPFYQDFIGRCQDLEAMKKQFQRLINETYDFVVDIDIMLRENNSFRKVK